PAAGSSPQAAAGPNQPAVQVIAGGVQSPLSAPRPARPSWPVQPLARLASRPRKRGMLARLARPVPTVPTPQTQSALAAASFPPPLTAPEAHRAARARER